MIFIKIKLSILNHSSVIKLDLIIIEAIIPMNNNNLK